MLSGMTLNITTRILFDREQLQAASGYAMDFPNRVRGAAMDWLAQYAEFLEKSC